MATRKEKYGDEKEITKKRKTTSLERFGVECVLSLAEVRNKASRNYDEIVAKRSITVLNKKINDPIRCILLDKELMEASYKKHTLEQMGEKFGIPWETIRSALINHGIERNNWRSKSGVEQEVADFVSSLGFDVVRNSRKIITPLEIDIFIPEKNLAIELDGMYWHSTIDETKKNYHKDKTIACEKENINLLHITDYEWTNKNEIWKSVISNKLGLSNKIYARNCTFVEIDKKLGHKFVEENHLQGGVYGGNYYGLYFGDKLVSVLQISTSRFNKNYDHEILRFCSLLNTTVVGGFGKLIKNSGVSGRVVSYANRRWSNGKLYKSAGFNFIYINKLSGLGTKSDVKQKRMEASGSKQSLRSPKIRDL